MGSVQEVRDAVSEAANCVEAAAEKARNAGLPQRVWSDLHEAVTYIKAALSSLTNVPDDERVCAVCEHQSDPEDSVYCADCGAYVCQDCADVCEGTNCNEFVCEECNDRADYNRNYECLCSSCRGETCEQCGLVATDKEVHCDMCQTEICLDCVVICHGCGQNLCEGCDSGNGLCQDCEEEEDDD